MPSVDIIAGARPNFMKIAPIIRAIEERGRAGSSLGYRLLHTGQHYDPKMSGDFFEQLGIPEPAINFGVGSGTHAEQTAGIMLRYEEVLREEPTDLCLVVGDVTSTMACAITAQKLWIDVAHVEGGLRSGDWRMPEEINRIVTDSISNYFFTTSRGAGEILAGTGVEQDRIFFVGNTMIDTLLANLERLRQPDFWEDHGLEEGGYLAMTLHRPSNVDGLKRLGETLAVVGEAAGDRPVVFPAHPRTAKALAALPPPPGNIRVVEPLGYLEFNYLVRHAQAVITDSGGITEETTVMGVPCLTLRDSTERPETVDVGTNFVVGTDPRAIPAVLQRVFDGEWPKGAIPEKWDGRAGERIAEILDRLLTERRARQK